MEITNYKKIAAVDFWITDFIALSKRGELHKNLASERLSVCFGWMGWEGESLGHYVGKEKMTPKIDLISGRHDFGFVPYFPIKNLEEREMLQN